MAENKVEKTEVPEECPLKEKKEDKVAKKEEKEEKVAKKDEEVNNVENGDVKEKNGKQEADDEKEVCEKTACKRKSTGGGDAPDGTPAEEAPEKKVKTDEKAAKEEEVKPTEEEVTA